MTNIRLEKMSTPELVDRFAALAVSQGAAIFDGQISVVNRLYHEIEAVKDELKDRPGDQRKHLVPLLAHTNIQVRLKAALATQPVAPVAARAALQAIVDAGETPQCMDAFLALR